MSENNDSGIPHEHDDETYAQRNINAGDPNNPTNGEPTTEERQKTIEAIDGTDSALSNLTPPTPTPQEQIPETAKPQVSAEPTKKVTLGDLEKGANVAPDFAGTIKAYVNGQDMSGYFELVCGSRQDADEAFASEDVSESILSDPESYPHRLAQATLYGVMTRESRFMRETLDRIATEQREVLDKVVGAVDKFTHSTGKDGGVTLSGTDAVVATIAATRGLKKVRLWNSGFWVLLRPFTISELIAFFREVDTEAKQFGRILGSNFYMFADYFLKKKFCELIRKAVKDSNLKKWNVGSTLVENISLHDFRALVAAACSLLYREGISTNLLCTEPDCKHVEKNQVIDLDNITYYTIDRMSKKAKQHMLSGTVISAHQLQEYRKNLLDFSEDYNLNNEMILVFDVPTMDKYLNWGDSLFASIMSATRDELDTSIAEVMSEIAINYYRAFHPWVSELRMLNKDGSVQFRTTDAEAISEVLTVDRLEDSDFTDTITKFIQDTALTHIAYAPIACPLCGKTASTQDAFITFDVLSTFFFLACQASENVR